jgi:NADH dehydrogenase
METHAHELLGKSILGGKPAIILGSGARPMNFVAVRDVATVAVRALTDPTVRNTIIEIGGPENLTRNEVAELYARMSGRSLRVRHIPVGALRVLARLLAPIHPGVSDVIRASIAFESIDQRFDPSRTLRRYPASLTSLETFVRERVDAAHGRAP